MSKLSQVVFSFILALATGSLAMGCAEQKGAQKKKDDKKAVDSTAKKADKQE